MGTHGRSLAVAAMAVVTLLVGTVGAPVAAHSGGSTAEAGLLASLGTHTSVTRNPTTDRVGYLGGSAARPVASAAALGHPTTAQAASRTFMIRYGALFGVPDATRTLRVSRTEHVAGRTFVRYQQTYRGLPVVAGELIVQVSPRNDVISVTGEASPDVSLSTRSDISATRARTLAIAATARQETAKPSSLRAGKPFLSIYDPRLTGDPRAIPVARLAWRVDVTSSRSPIREFVAIDAHSGVLAAVFNQIAYLDPPANATQRVCDLKGQPADPGEGTTDPLQCDPGDATLVSNPGASGVADVLGAFHGAEATFDFYARHFGRNSLDDAGLTLISTARYCPDSGCPLHNAFWDGTQMIYGVGYAAADDVVGHELTHGVTEFTSGLLYYFQSGAINESMSDIFGEFIDQQDGIGTDTVAKKWLLGEDMPIGAIRNMKNPPASLDVAQPDKMTSHLWFSDPTFNDQGGVHYNSGVGNKAAYLITDGATFNGQTISGIGIDKAAAIFYRVDTELLSSGADYAALADALHQACSDLVGTHPNGFNGNPSGSGVITAANCTQVDKTITATVMRGTPPSRAIKHANWCSSGTPTTTPFDDPIDSLATGWATSSNARTGVIDNYATSAPYSLAIFDATSASDINLRTKRITLPSSGPIYLGFRHFYNTQAPFDGGRVEYTTNATGSAGWTAIPAAKWVFNGPGTTIAHGFGDPIQGSKAFSGFSNGWTFSKADLTSLKGKKIFVRFRYGDSNGGSRTDGWFLDDVRVYKCVTDTTKPTVSKPSVELVVAPLGSDSLPAPVAISFNASDADGIVSTSLRRKVGSGDPVVVDLPGVAATSVATRVPVSTSSQTFTAGARDGGNNLGSASTTLHVLATQDSAASVTGGSWPTEAAAGYFGGSVVHAATAADHIAATFDNVTSLAVVSDFGPARGIVDIYIDGVFQSNVDLYQASVQNRQVIFSSVGGAGTHTIEIRATGNKNASSSSSRVDLDAFLAITN